MVKANLMVRMVLLVNLKGSFQLAKPFLRANGRSFPAIADVICWSSVHVAMEGDRCVCGNLLVQSSVAEYILHAAIVPELT